MLEKYFKINEIRYHGQYMFSFVIFLLLKEGWHWKYRVLSSQKNCFEAKFSETVVRLIVVLFLQRTFFLISLFKLSSKNHIISPTFHVFHVKITNFEMIKPSTNHLRVFHVQLKL